MSIQQNKPDIFYHINHPTEKPSSKPLPLELNQTKS